MASRAREHYPGLRWSRLGPEWDDPGTWIDDDAVSIDREPHDLTVGDSEEPCALVCCHDVSGRSLDFDLVQYQGQPRDSYPEQDAQHCKNQHQLHESKCPSHAGA